MDIITTVLLLAALVLGAGLIILAFLYVSLAGGTESRARQMFEEWQRSTLEREAGNRADILNREWVLGREKASRADAVKQSGAIIRGNVTQALVPYFPDFAWNPRDTRFIGTPIDLIIFSGLSEEKELDRIIFVEVKSGKTGALSESQKKVKRYLENGGLVTFSTIHTGTRTDTPL
ncbi:MAG: Holliday junction resolvase [Methanomicrobiales archaeon]|nr:Holliday junction resolvase [Methanomicrobiales archaeon]